jgi:hypothetical protein
MVLLIAFILILKLVYHFHFQFETTAQTTTSQLIVNAHNHNYKVLQLLTTEFLNKTWWPSENKFLLLDDSPFSTCRAEQRCYITSPLARPLSNSDAVLVHLPNLGHKPWRSENDYVRRREQLWVFSTLESQARSFCSLHYSPADLDDWFNLSVTFKPDSDLVMDYRPFRGTWNSLPKHSGYMTEFKKLFAEVKTLDGYKRWLTADLNNELGLDR